MKKITKKEMFETIRTLAESGALHACDVNEDITDDDVIAFCDKEIAALDAKAAKAKETAAKKKAEGDALRDAVLAVLTDEFQPIADIAAQVDSEDATVGKVTNRLAALAAAGLAVKTQITVGETGAKRKISAYKVAGEG